MTVQQLTSIGTLQIRDEEKREIEALVVPWDTDADTARGVERFSKGAFDGIDPGRFVLRQRHQDPPTGRGISLESADDGLHMAFKVAKTATGDEQLELIREGVETGISVGFEEGKVDRKKLSDGRMQYIHQSVNPDGQLEVSTTWRPAYREASVLQLREQEMADQEAPAVEGATPAASPDQLSELREVMLTRIEHLEQRQTASQLQVPAAEAPRTTERRVEIHQRELEDVITVGNEGVVPDAFVNRMIGRISTGRPFLNAMTEIPAPAAGTSIVLPKITQGPEVAKQAAEKDDVASQATVITTVDFPMETYAGAGDLSLQLIRRSSPEFMGLWLELLGEQYAKATENAAIDNLLAVAAVVEGGAFDVTEPSFGEAFTNTTAATSGTMKPNRIILSTAALVAFMDAREPSGGGGGALYPSLGGIGGVLAGGGNGELGVQLTPVWAPELDDEAVDIIIGPSAGFIWCEDGAFQLAADVPSKAGRDIGLAGFIWFGAIYPAAFTTYTLAT